MRKLLETLYSEMSSRYNNGIYHRMQINFAYNSNHIEGSRLTHEQTRFIFDTKTIGFVENSSEAIRVNDIIETVNHFRCFDYIVKTAKDATTEKYVKELHRILKSGIIDDNADVVIGDYKAFPNEVGFNETTLPRNVPQAINKLLSKYDNHSMSIYDIAEFHVMFEKIHPFYDGNGRIGRLLMFKQCLANDIVPVFIDEFLKQFYYKGIEEWSNENLDERLINVFLSAQENTIRDLKYFEIDFTMKEQTYKDIIKSHHNKKYKDITD